MKLDFVGSIIKDFLDNPFDFLIEVFLIFAFIVSVCVIIQEKLEDRKRKKRD